MSPRRLLAAVLLLCLAVTSADAAEVIFIVRHAERETGQGDDSLSEAGKARAERLAKILADEGINYIFTSDRKRTIETASPTVAMRQIMAFTIAIADQKPGGPDPAIAQVQATVDAIKDAPGFAHVLIVGHSNTVPLILKALGATEEVTIRDDEFDNLFVVYPVKGGTPKVVRRKF